MPKYNILLKAGEQLPDNVSQLIISVFNPSDIVKLKKFGGRIQISITAPFSEKRHLDKGLVIDEEFIKKLMQNPKAADEYLDILSKKQLTILGKLLHFSVNQKYTTKEIKNNILSFIQAPDKWEKIIGKSNF